MRLFKANQATQSEEDRVRDLRLTSIASRYRARPEISLVPDAERESEPQPELSQEAQFEPQPELSQEQFEPHPDVEPEAQPELLLDPEPQGSPDFEQKPDDSE